MQLIGDGATAQCANCGVALTGPYCAQCGQHAHSSSRSLGVLLHDGWHVLTHVDSRLWRTLSALLLRPGRLTTEYFADRRERYIPPLRLYIIISILLFAVPGVNDKPRVQVQPAASTATSTAAPAQAPERARRKGCEDIQLSSPSLQGRLKALCERTLADNGASFVRIFKAAVPRMMFLFLPLLAAYMLLLYWRPRRLYVEHLVFFLHTHAASFLMLVLLLAIGWLEALLPALAAVSDWLDMALILYIVFYLYRALRRYYGQSRRQTLLKAFLIALGYSVCLVLMLALTTLYTALVV